MLRTITEDNKTGGAKGSAGIAEQATSLSQNDLVNLKGTHKNEDWEMASGLLLEEKRNIDSRSGFIPKTLPKCLLCARI